jgi:hypothetical protein
MSPLCGIGQNMHLCDDAIFIASCINHALEDEIWWPTLEEKLSLGAYLREISRCIGFIDGTMIEIRKPWQNEAHGTWFNGWKKIYAMNNVILDHHGLFIYIDISYHGSYHDVTILRHFSVYKNWRQYFIHGDDYFEYLLGDPSYMNE